jgi:uncharacterized repeat protein (TIGR01451 family)
MEEEGIRVTTKNKSKKIVTILLAITGVLGLVLVGVAIYFYSIKDTTGSTTTTNVTCGCYFIDPAVTSDCGDPRRAFKFQTLTVPSTQTCKASCSTSTLSTNLLNSSTQQNAYEVCQVQTITDARCQSMTITDENGKIVTGEVSSSEKLNIEATFDQAYSNYKFTINNETSNPDSTSSDNLTIKKAITDLTSATAINIVATATTSTNDQINSPICRRLIEVTQPSTSTVTNLSLQTISDSGATKISSAKISTGALNSSNTTKVDFTFGTVFPELVMTQGFTINTSTGSIDITQADLYNSANFSNGSSFTQLNSYVGDLVVKAEIFVNNSSIGSASQTVAFTNTNTNTGGGTDTGNTVASNFTVTNTSSQTCLERVSPSNTVLYTIVVTNKSSASQSLTSVTDKLPLGFTYTAGTTQINGTTVSDSAYITTTNVGDSQEMTIAKLGGWTLSANQALTIVFQSVAGANALTGDNLNEVVITPEQIPTDTTTLRTSVKVTVAQDCSNTTGNNNSSTPQTGIFETTALKIVIGLIVIALGWYIYTKPQGQLIASKVVDSEIFKSTELNTWRIFKPKKYFEEVVVRKISKKKN